MKKFNSRQSNTPIKNWGTELNKELNSLNGQEAPKDMFMILSLQGNASQNNPESPPYTSQNG